MPATAIAHLPELEAAPLPVSPAPQAEPSPAADDNLDWRHVESYIEAFAGSEEIEEARKARRKPRRYRSFQTWSGVTVAATLPFGELMGLVWLRTINLGASREAARLDKEIRLTQESISQTQRGIAALNSSPQLSRWATDLGYRPAQSGDYDDITKNDPMPSSAANSAAAEGVLP